jgi:ribulose-phosphate 3-epimerase
MERVLIAPSLLSADFTRLGEEVSAVEAGGADWLHFDVMDGRFVPNITVGPAVLEGVARVASVPVDVHLMVREPDHLLEAFVKVGADPLTVHVEACTHLDRTLRRIRELGARPGVSLNPGFGGQGFIESSLGKIAALRDVLDRRRLPARLEVDGGLSTVNAGRVAAAGADVLVAGNAVFRSPDYAAVIRGMREAAEAARPRG